MTHTLTRPATRLWRAAPADLEIRGSDGRTLAGIVAPFDSPTEIATMFTRELRSASRAIGTPRDA